MTRFVYNPAVEPALARGSQMRDAMLVRAEVVAAAARAIAPVGTIPHKFKGGQIEPVGAYRDSIVGEAGLEARGYIGRVNAYNWKAHFIEFGTGPPGPTPAFATLRTAAEQVGFHLVGG